MHLLLLCSVKQIYNYNIKLIKKKRTMEKSINPKSNYVST